jgi:hypothetical protein
VTVTEVLASTAGTEATEDEETEVGKKKFPSCGQEIQDHGEADGIQVEAEGTDISSTPSGDVDILEGQDQEPVAGSGTHFDGVVS